MRYSVIALLPLILFFIGIMACKPDTGFSAVSDDMTNNGNTDTMSNQPIVGPIRIQIGTQTFTATLLDNPSARAFKVRLPITVSMIELNGNEKYYNFPNAGPLPTAAVNPGTINTGDLMLYGSSTLVLFYKPFSTSYSYTRMGRIDNPVGLEQALGSGNATVRFELP